MKKNNIIFLLIIFIFTAYKIKFNINYKALLPIFNEINNNMINCPSGKFFMGSPDSELGRWYDENRHEVLISKDFKISKFPVTQKQYEIVMGENPSYFRYEKNPVERVNYDDAKEFCKKLNYYFCDLLPDGYVFDLPSEAQWEYACRANSSSSLHFSKNLTSDTFKCDILNEFGWYCENSLCSKPVGNKRPNEWGIYDMIGNVWEWCSDWYDEYPNQSVIDPKGPVKGTCRVLRGGAWNSRAWCCRSARRFSFYPTINETGIGFNVGYNIGFRIAIVPKN